MRKSVLLFSIISFLFFSSYSSWAQFGTLDKLRYDVELGTWGVWFGVETQLNKSFSLRAQAGLNNPFLLNGVFLSALFLSPIAATIPFQPEIIVEPRFYYRLNSTKDKVMKRNQTHMPFFTIVTSYLSEPIRLKKNENDFSPQVIKIMPAWGFRSKISDHVYNEMITGLGLAYDLDYNDRMLYPYFRLKVGYIF